MKEIMEEYGTALLGAAGSILFLQLAGRLLLGPGGVLVSWILVWGGF